MSSHSDIDIVSPSRGTRARLRRTLLIRVVLAAALISTAQSQSIYTVAAPPDDGTSTGVRGPNGLREHAYHRTATFISASELTLIPVATKITRMGFVIVEGASTRVHGNLSIFVANADDISSGLRTTWAEILSGMTSVYNGPFTIPDTAELVDVMLAVPFVYSGKSLYVAYDFQSSGPYAARNAVYASNTSLMSSTRSAFSATEPPSVLDNVSSFRPVLRLGFPFPSMQWKRVASGTQQDLRALDIVDDSTAWICASSGEVYRTTNRGTTWQGVGSPANSARSLVGLTKLTAVVVTETDSGCSKMFQTTNGGTNWTQVYKADSGVSVSLVGKTSSWNLWGFSGPANDTLSVLSSVDWGSTWISSASGVVFPRGFSVSRGSSCRINQVIWFGASGPNEAADRVYRFATGPGGPWTFSSTGGRNTVALAFSSPNGVGLAAHGDCPDTISRTTDGGLTWTSVVVSGMGEVKSLACFRGGKDFWTATSSGIWHTPNNGETWEQTFSSSTSGGALSCISFFANFQNGLAVGPSGLILRGSWILNPVLAVENEEGVPACYSLEPNYPNPFNSVTRIEFSIPRSSVVTLKLFDLLGREVAMLVSGQRDAGKHTIEWDTGGYSSGVYFYRLQVDNYIRTRTMVLLK